jgi:apolipoprotein D and lipocalin family protein
MEGNMPRQHLKFTTAAILMALLLSLAPHTPGQSVTPVPKLDPDRLIGTYYEIARYPIKREEHCVSNEMVLYALGDKRNAFQIVTSCQSKQDNSEYWNKTGKLGKSANGEIRLGSFWPFAAKYWMLAIAPDSPEPPRWRQIPSPVFSRKHPPKASTRPN